MSPIFWNRLGLVALAVWLLSLLAEQFAQRRRPVLELVEEYTSNGQPADDREEVPVP